MPLISAKPIRQPRGHHECAICHVAPLGAHVQLYGTPKDGGRPFSMRVHVRCIPQQRVVDEPKIAAAIQALKDAAEAASPSP